MPVEQGLPWHPVVTGLAGQAIIPFVVAASHAHALPSPPFWFPILVASPALLRPSSLSVVLALVPPGGFRVLCVCVAPPPICWRSWVPLLRTHSCPTRLPTPYADFTSPGHGPVTTPVMGTSRRAGRNRHPCGVCGHLVEGGGLFVVCVPPNLVLFFLLLVQSPLLVCAAGGTACRSLPPVAVVGWSHCDLGGTRGTGHFCTCLQICKLTCHWDHWCLLRLFCGECDVLLLLCILGCRGAPCLRTSLRAVHASELGTRVSPPPVWSCAVTTNGLDVVSHKRAQGPCTRPW